jgi:hypothetical protein
MSEESSMGAPESEPAASAPASEPEDLPAPSRPLWRHRTTMTGPHGAEQAFNSDVRFNSGSGGASQQPVTGLGDQAVAVFGSVGTSRTLLLFVWSSNAEIQISYTINQGPSMPTRAVQLAAAIAIARDLLAGQLSA